MPIQAKNYQPDLMYGADLLSGPYTDSATTTGIAAQYTFSAITSGAGMKIIGPGAALLAAGDVVLIDMGLATTGDGIMVQTTGVYTATTASPNHIVANSLTSGYAHLIEVTGMTSGIGVRVNATAATLTTGRYFSAYDAATETFGIGANGHIHTTQTTAPTIVVTQQNGITAAAVTAGSSDTTGVFTTTGTNNNGGTTILTVTFNKTYTTAPKSVQLTGANASAVLSGTIPYISSITATTFVVTIPASASSGATPSWYYQVIA